MKTSFSSTLVLSPFLILAQTPEKPDAFAFLDHISAMDKVYSLNLRISKRSFQLEVCSAKCEKTQAFSKTVDAETLTSDFANSTPKLFLKSKRPGSI